MRGLLAFAVAMLPALGAADAVVAVATQNRSCVAGPLQDGYVSEALLELEPAAPWLFRIGFLDVVADELLDCGVLDFLAHGELA